VTVGSPVDADVLQRISRLQLRARALTAGGRVGLHRSRKEGYAAEFEDWDPYRPGLDVRRIDWRAWARTDRLLVRRSRVDTDVPVYVVLDASADLDTGPHRRAGQLPDLERGKAGTAIALAATLAMACWHGGEPIGLHVLGGGTIQRHLPARRARSHLAELVRTLAVLVPSGRADLGATLAASGALLPRRSVAFVVSDAMEPLPSWGHALRGFAQRRIDVRFLHVRSAAELRLEGFDVAWLRSPESGEERLVDAAATRERVRLAVMDHDASVRAAVHAARGLWWAVDVDRDLSAAVLGALQGREAPS
jgi:uncharacterized protein (DUF58 family)